MVPEETAHWVDDSVDALKFQSHVGEMMLVASYDEDSPKGLSTPVPCKIQSSSVQCM